MRSIGAAALAAWLLLPAAASAQLGAAVSPSQRSTPIPALDAGSEQVAVVKADDLAGRSLTARHGEAAGRITHVLVDPASGAVRAVLVDDVPDLSLDRQSLVVPWSKLTPGTAGHTMDLAMTGAELANAPRIRSVAFTAGARPEITAQIIDFDNDVTSSEPPPPIDLTSPPPPQDFLTLPSGPRTTVAAGPPVLVSAQALRGVAVADQDGNPLGAIGPVMIDLAQGHVAYLLIADGGLDAPKAWLPVPIEVLVPAGDGYALGVETFWLRQVPPLASDTPPGAVGSAWLEALYDNYGVAPYWRQKSP